MVPRPHRTWQPPLGSQLWTVQLDAGHMTSQLEASPQSTSHPVDCEHSTSQFVDEEQSAVQVLPEPQLTSQLKSVEPQSAVHVVFDPQAMLQSSDCVHVGEQVVPLSQAQLLPEQTEESSSQPGRPAARTAVQRRQSRRAGANISR
jgi:hypothetical protein